MTLYSALIRGGSKTHAVVADGTGRILGTGRSFDACHSNTGMETAMVAVREASQQALGLRVLQAVFDANCGMRSATRLIQSVLAHFDCNTVDELLYRHVAGTLEVPRIRQLPLLLEASALQGDPETCVVLDAFGRDIAQYAAAGLRKLDMLQTKTEVVRSGSVFKCHAPQLMESVCETILRSAPQAVIVESVYEPVLGAVLLALDALADADADLIARSIKRNARAHHLLRKIETRKDGLSNAL